MPQGDKKDLQYSFWHHFQLSLFQKPSAMAKFKAQLIVAASVASGSRKLVFLAHTLIMLPLWLRATAARYAASGVRAASISIL
jgi:hypothetical protein